MISNCVVLGSGRSGTSMAVGVLAKAGYFMGDELYPGDDGNMKGYFEDVEINSINEDLLAKFYPEKPAGIIGDIFFRSRMTKCQRWLAEVPVGVNIRSTRAIEERIKKLTAREPFCFKDPRFCYTLPVWRRYLKNTVYLCVFRHPAVTASSILSISKRKRYLQSLNMSFERALRIWELMYAHILDVHSQEGEWIYAHYEQFLDGSVFEKLENVLCVSVDKGFPDSKLKHSLPKGDVSENALNIFKRLCDLSGYKGYIRAA